MSGPTSPTSTGRVLRGVPRVGFYRGGPRPPQDDPLPACLAAILEFRGELPLPRLSDRQDPWHEVHLYFMGVTGLGFRFGWRPPKGDLAAHNPTALSPDPLEPFRRGVEAAGYACEILLRRGFARELGLSQEEDPSEPELRERILRSIDRGMPVLAFGVVGPPEVCLITGYDQGGDVLVGWSYFQEDEKGDPTLSAEPSGEFRKSGWYKATQGLVLLTDPRPLPPLGEVYRKALRFGLETLRTPLVRGVPAGRSGLTRWADGLLHDEWYSTEEPKDLAERHEIHWLTVGTLAEARAWGAGFLRQAVEELPQAADELHAAGDCFDGIHDLCWAIWEFTVEGRWPKRDDRKFADAGVRRRIVPLIRLIRKLDQEAAEHLESALARLGEPAGVVPEQLILEGVPRAGWSLGGCPFPASLAVSLEYLGDPPGYDYLMGVSGAAFRRLWERDDGGNVDLMYLAPEPLRRTFHALGYGWWVVPHQDREKMLSAIRESLGRGCPVLGFGIVGPPECGVITGYSRGGDVLHGWSHYQDSSFEGYFEQPDWHLKMSKGWEMGLVVIDDKRGHTPSPRETLIASLEWAIDLARKPVRPEAPGHVSGLAAYEAWAAALEVDADYPKDDPEVLGVRVMVHGDQVVMLGDRAPGARYLRSMVGAAPEAAQDLNAAADLLEQVAHHEDVWPWGDDMGPATQRALADPETRRTIARHVRAAAAKEARAIDHLERALAVLKG